MAIPPANPPPRYEPPPRNDSPPEPPALESQRGPAGPPPGLDPRARGCVMVLGVLGALACVASVAIAASCRGCMQIGEAQAVRQVTAGYRAAAAVHDETDTDEADLRALEQLGDQGTVSILAFAVLSNRYNDALANDGRVDADELHRGMELVHDIVAGQGNVDMNRYPEGR